MFDELHKYKNKGHFFFKKGQLFSQESKNVPDKQGVYYIFRLAQHKVDMVYIGKSETIEQNGEYINQSLREMFDNKRQNVKRQVFFEQKMIEEDIEALDIYWFVTFDEKHQDLPEYAKGLIMQSYFETFGELPPWNEEYQET